MSETEWPEVTLGDHVDLLSGFAFKSKQFTDEPDDIPLVKGANVHQGFIDWETAKRWPTTELNGCEKYFLELDDVVLAMDRPWIEAGLKWAWIRPEHPKSLLVQRVSRMRGLDDLDTRFLRYLIGSPQFTDYIRPIVTGVNVPHISGGQIKGFTFRLPPLPTQRKIASILSAYDDLIENNTRRIAILEEMAQAIYREWFAGFRFPGHENVKLVDSPLGQIPEGWAVGTVGDFGKIITGKTPSKKRPKLFGGDIQFVRTPDMHGNLFCLSTADTLSDEGMASQPKQTVPANSVCISCIGTVGVISITASTCQTNQQINTIIPKTAHWREYIVLTLKQNAARLKQMGAGGVTMDNISKGKLTAFDVLLPSDKTLQSFSPFVADVFDRIHLLQRQNENLRTTRDLLLPKLISGKLDVEDLDIDSGLTAEALEEATL